MVRDEIAASVVSENRALCVHYIVELNGKEVSNIFIFFFFQISDRSITCARLVPASKCEHMTAMVAPGWREICKCFEAMGNTMVEFGLVRILHGLGGDTLDKDLLRALWMASEAAVYMPERKTVS